MPSTIEKYTVTQLSVQTILGYIRAGDIAIPEIQRPFVWSATQVRAARFAVQRLSHGLSDRVAKPERQAEGWS